VKKKADLTVIIRKRAEMWNPTTGLKFARCLKEGGGSRVSVGLMLILTPFLVGIGIGVEM
jgi:hypothetical protein